LRPPVSSFDSVRTRVEKILLSAGSDDTYSEVVEVRLKKLKIFLTSFRSLASKSFDRDASTKRESKAHQKIVKFYNYRPTQAALEEELGRSQSIGSKDRRKVNPSRQSTPAASNKRANRASPPSSSSEPST